MLASGNKLENLTKPRRFGAIVPLASAEEHRASCAGFRHNFSSVSPLTVSLVPFEFGVCRVDETALSYQLDGGYLE